MQSANTVGTPRSGRALAPICGGKVGHSSGRYAVSWDHCRIVDAGRRYPQHVGVAAGKRRWYATIFSVERPRSRSTSTERRGRSLSRAGAPPRSSSPWPPSCQPLVFTRATSGVHLAVPPLSHQNSVVYGNRVRQRPYSTSLTGMRRRACVGVIDPALTIRSGC